MTILNDERRREDGISISVDSPRPPTLDACAPVFEPQQTATHTTGKGATKSATYLVGPGQFVVIPGVLVISVEYDKSSVGSSRIASEATWACGGVNGTDAEYLRGLHCL